MHYFPNAPRIFNMKDGSVDIVTFPSYTDIHYASQLSLPTINENYRFKKYCNAYGLVPLMDNVNYANMSIVKKEKRNSTDRSWLIKNHYLTEA